MKTMAARGTVVLACGSALLASCARPPLTLYTLGQTAAPDPPALDNRAKIIEIAVVSLPDEIDSEDILLRDGSRLRRSAHGRWGSRLSLQVTDLITQRMAAARP